LNGLDDTILDLAIFDLTRFMDLFTTSQNTLFVLPPGLVRLFVTHFDQSKKYFGTVKTPVQTKGSNFPDYSGSHHIQKGSVIIGRSL